MKMTFESRERERVQRRAVEVIRREVARSGVAVVAARVGVHPRTVEGWRDRKHAPTRFAAERIIAAYAKKAGAA